MKLLNFFKLYFLLVITIPQYIYSIDVKKIYYAIEIDNVICGYTEATETTFQRDGREFINQKLEMFLMLSLFGSEFNTQMEINSIIDPLTKKCYNLKGVIKQGNINRTFEVNVENSDAFIKSTLMPEPKTIKLTPDILFGSDEVYSKVKKEFVDNNAEEISFNILEAIDSDIQRSTFKKLGTEKIELAGRTFETIIIEQMNNKTGVKIKYWLSPELDYFAMFQVLNRKIYLSDHTIVDRIKVANMDGSILTKTNKSISDIQAITYMKLKVQIEPTGVNLTPEDLNVSGQKFEGEVKNNLIDGILEINYKRYSGENAPAFPPDYKNDEGLQKYLQPSNQVESDDPILIKEAQEITSGAKNSWEAANLLSRWVAEKIHYAIPGGGSARGAYDMKAGECGAHSMLLAAFCRAVGIPARVVYGGMYVPNQGGAFGQHAWNEIYMGEAGWIPVDATAFEIDYVDAGHIRISEHRSTVSSFNAKSIEILDYKLNGKSPEVSLTSNEMFAPFLGKYKNPESGKIFEVLIKEGNLCVDIPGQMVLPFNNQNDNGKWFCKLSNRIYIEFDKDNNGNISEMKFHEVVTLPRQPDTSQIAETIPDDFKPYIGNYLFAAINAVFKVEFIDNTLSVYDPTENKSIKLQSQNGSGGWVDEFNKNTIYFESNAEGKITGMKIDARNKFVREQNILNN
jgi:transglutaminase-like putative cysteine protease